MELTLLILINGNLVKLPVITVTFQGKKMEDHILEIPSIEVFDAKCFNCDTTQLCSRINPAWNKDDIEVVI